MAKGKGRWIVTGSLPGKKYRRVTFTKDGQVVKLEFWEPAQRRSARGKGGERGK